ncbi:MAG TPA: tRNA pseudouridine(38-40) synthase TruA [Thermomicrobiaceae bacterium]|nr:tRNA pseudouridine(38-40) synthase TruA [Thermomicrobiaceae bacterium]
MERRVFRIDLGYDGTDFAGSQVQPGVRTVQGVLEEALARLTGEPARLALAGRTDRGVHAVGQVASGTLRWERPAAALLAGLRALTPPDVAIYRVALAPASFHARFDAVAREYRYRVWSGGTPPLLLRRLVWHQRRALDLEAMGRAAEALPGEQDFAAVAGGGAGVPWAEIDTTRRVNSARWVVLQQSIEPGEGARLLEFRIVASGYLPQMVRNIVGDLVQIGRGERQVAWMAELLRGRDRRLGAAPAPPEGLALWHVSYT